jgi:Isopropylmalate/homocitrate/citramalate synthases
MSGWPNVVEIGEVGPRDGLQNEAIVPVVDRIRLIDALSATGLRRIEAVSFVSPQAIPPMAGAAEVMAGITRRDRVTYRALVPNVKGAELALAAAADEIEVVVSASETHNRRNVKRSVDESIGAAGELTALAHGAKTPVEAIVSTAFGCPYEGDVPEARVASIAARLRDGGADRLSFGDTTGMATPRRVNDVLDALDAVGISASDVGLHFHNTRGTGLANVLAALQRGVTRFDASIGGLGGCPYAPGATGNIVTEDLVHMLEDMGIDTGVDLDALIDCAQLAQAIVGRELPGQVMRAGPRSRTVETTS